MKLIVWGANSYGQLGLGVRSELIEKPSVLSSSRLTTLPDLKTIKAIHGGGGHILILTKDGCVYGCGWNNVGQLMVDESIVLDFVRLPQLENYNVIQVATKWDSCYAVTEDGLCLGWGSNAYNQLGHSCDEFVSTREPVIIAKNVKEVECGGRHVVILTKNGTVITFGDSKLGKLGRIHVEGGPVISSVPVLENIESVACGFNHSIALSDDGKVYGWGCNKWGQLGKDPMDSRWIAEPCLLFDDIKRIVSSIHAGWSSTHFHTKENTLINFGRNNYGQLGQRDNPELKPWEFHLLSNISKISTGSEHVLGLTGDGQLVSWGWNEHGSCGNGSVENLFSPTPVMLENFFKIELIAAASGFNYALVEELGT